MHSAAAVSKARHACQCQPKSKREARRIVEGRRSVVSEGQYLLLLLFGAMFGVMYTSYPVCT